MSYDLGTAHGTIEVDYDGAKEVAKAERDLRKMSKASKDTDGSLKKMGASLGAIGAGAKLGAIGASMGIAAVQAANLAVQLAGIVPQLASIGSLAAALPGLILGGAVAVGVLKASFAGVGDAVKAAFDTEHPEKFEEAIKKLSPAAQTFAKTVQANVPALKAFQQGLQETFFKSAGLTDALKGGITALQGMKPELTALTGAMGGITKKFVDFALQSRSIDLVKNSIKAFTDGMKSAATAQTPLQEGLRAVGEVGLPLLKRLGEAVGKVGTQFGNWLSQIAADGTLKQFIDTAISTLKTLGGILKNVGSIFNSIFSAASSTGGGLLDTIKTITGEFATFLKSAEGSAALRALFKGIGDVARALAPIITTVAGALAGALGPALSSIAKSLGPALLSVVKALAPALGPLAMAIAAIATAIAPILPPLAKFIGMFATLASGLLTTLAANLTPLIGLIGDTMVSAFEAFEPVLEQVMAQLPELATVGLQLVTALLPLVPAILTVVSAFAEALLPVLPQLIDAALQLVPTIIEIAEIFANDLAPALIQLVPLIPPIVTALIGMAKVQYTLIGLLLKLVAIIIRVGVAIFNFGKAVGQAMVKFAQAVGTAIGKAIVFFQGLPGKAKNALSSLGSAITGVAKRAWTLFTSAVTAGINAVLALGRALPGRVRSAIASLGGAISGVARAAWTAFKTAVNTGINNTLALVRQLPGRIKSGLSNLGGLLVNSGRDVIMGLVRGMSGAIGAAVNAAKNVGKAIIGGVKSALKIGSPSKEMIKIGRWVNDGLIEGMTGTAKQVRAASTKLANIVLDAYSDRLISKGKKKSLLKTINKNNVQLQKLANKAATIAGKLKTAQAKLADVQKKYNEAFAEARDATKSTFSLVGEGLASADVQDAKARFRIAIDQAKAFAANIAKLVKRGLNKDLIAQLIAQGPEAGGAMAKALAGADNATLKEFNSLQAEMNKAADAVGKSAADSMYGAGLRAAQGLVKGLASQQKQIESLMLKIAKSMEKAIKKALHIKSPSRVMFKLGEFISKGLALGIEHLRSQVDKAALGLANATIMPTVRLTEASQPVNVPQGPSAAQAASQAAETANQDFGPYYLMLDGKVVSGFVVNAITGNPKVVSKAAKEGDQQNAWSGSGRRAG